MDELLTFMDISPGIVFLIDEEGNMVRWNRQFAAHTGYAVEELDAMHALKLVYIDDHENAEKFFAEAMEEGRADAELRICDKDGHVSLFYVTGARLIDERGARYFAGAGVDITNSFIAEEALRESEERYRNLVEAIPDLVLVFDFTGRLLYTSPSLERHTGFNFDEVQTSHTDSAFFISDETDTMQQAIQEFVQSGRPYSDVIENRLLGKDGQPHWYSTIFSHVQFKGQPALQVISRDITEQKLAEMALRESEERYALAARGANDGLWDLDLRTMEIYLSPRWKAILGDVEDESREHLKDVFPLFHPDDQELLFSRFGAHIDGVLPHFECEFRLHHKDGSFRWVQARGLVVRDEAGVPYRAAGSMSDITERKRIEAQLLYDAFHDGLTGLPNHALLTDRLEQAIRRQQRYHDFHYAVLYLDLDRFKDVNDSHGHPAGDQLLIAAAQRMQFCLRQADTLARLGGDEFGILQTEVKDASDAISLAERLQEELNRPFVIAGMDITHTSASIGIVLGDESYIRAEDILRDADIAMYRAKAQGKTCWRLFDTSMRSQVLARVRMEAELRKAIQEREMEVFYHPIIALDNGSFIGFEALARWRHPQQGIISPSEFIPLAEESLLVLPLDLLVLEKACRQVREWQTQIGLPIKISVNLSGRHFPQPGLVEEIRGVLQKTGLQPADLIVEITESAVMENFDLATITLKNLQRLGVSIEFDDFGKGQSSLTYLMKLPVNALKLDLSFIHQIGEDLRSAEIVNTVVRLGHTIGLCVVAEGVETVEQLARLKTMGCDFAQGYLISLPLDRDAAAEWLRNYGSGGKREFPCKIGYASRTEC
jgi:diguanylate cyclase (GGDEF)-like protein/PAS domain S-box-containing protein